MHILEQIVAHKKTEVEQRKQNRPLNELISSNHYGRSCNSYVTALENHNSSGIIAEFKKKSPSKSDINLSAKVEDVVQAYHSAGASAISILTDKHFFGGADEYLSSARQLLNDIPLLRKEFIIDSYQIHESKALGADIVLLISEILSKDEIREFTSLARSLDLEVLLELHSADQLYKCNSDVSVIGVNNRDLKTFEVDYERSKNLFDSLPVDIPKIAESGLSDPETCVMLYQHGFRGFLIGEQFMKQNDPGIACEEFIFEFMVKRRTL